MSEELPTSNNSSDKGCPYCGLLLCGTKRTTDGEVVAWGHTCLMVQLRKAHHRIAELEKQIVR